MYKLPSFNNIFKKASKTHYYASLFFPQDVRNEVEILYNFLRVVDDLIDEDPAQVDIYFQLKSYYYLLDTDLSYSLHIHTLNENLKNIVYKFVKLKKHKNFKGEWIDALFQSMEMDLNNYKYNTIDDTLKYIYGVAEVVGLMMAKLLNLNEDSYGAAQSLGRAAQFINMIRDIEEDRLRGRVYLPQSDLNKFNFDTLNLDSAQKNPADFIALINYELERFIFWLNESKRGFKFIPRKSLIPILTITDMYEWTANKIMHDPFIIFEKKVKPTKQMVISSALKNYIRA
jgi:15-cis-phytoene synthase